MNYFLRLKDYDPIIEEDKRNQIVKDNTNLLRSREKVAIELAKGSLAARYDMTKAFAPILPFDISVDYIEGDIVSYTEPAWNNATNYVANNRVSYQGYIYKALQNNTNKNPSTEILFWEQIIENEELYVVTADGTGNYPEDTAFFKQDDARNALLVDIVLNIALYLVHRRIAPRQIPETRKNAYEDSIVQLQDIASGTLFIDLPIKEEPVKSIEMGSNEKLQHYY